MNRYALGIDTSNYRTSCALLNTESGSFENIGELLNVPSGSLGLRQSDALFQHVRRLPELMERLCAKLDGPIAALGVSDRPRRREDSYMPCFLAGLSAARTAAAALRLQPCLFSHQEGHIASALYSADKLNWLGAPFLSWHLSGGTTELLWVRAEKQGEMDVQIIGGSRDLAAGQVIDRAGVALGLPFPAGPHLEALALSCDDTRFFRVRPDGLSFSLSGVENQFRAAIQRGDSSASVARVTLNTVTEAVRSVTAAAQREYSVPVLFSGGVSASAFLKKALPESESLCFAQKGLAGDNALGAAVLAARQRGIL